MSLIKPQYLEQYAGPFAMEETAFNSIYDYAKSIDLKAHIQQAADDEDDDMSAPLMAMTPDGIACISCVGSMTKYGSSLSSGPSTIALRKCLRSAAADPKCVGALMDFDSPGGTSDGTEELASEIAAFGDKKPIWGFANGMACSAAYWAMSQCSVCVAAPGSVVGSIGTYGVLYDRSAQFAQGGVKAVVIKAGQHKGTGVPGTEITADQITEQSRVVNQINDLFVAGVAKGRKLTSDQARALNDGRVHVGANAKAQGLVDQIGSYDDAMAGLRDAIAQAAKVKAKMQTQTRPGMSPGAKNTFTETHMSESATPAPEQTATVAPPAIQAASLKDLKAKFPKSTADWRESCQEAGMTLAQASEKWAEHLSAENTRLADELAQAKASAKPVGGKPLATTKDRAAGVDATASADPKAELNRIASEYVAQGMSRERAWARACKENDEVRKAWCLSHTDANIDKVAGGRK